MLMLRKVQFYEVARAEGIYRSGDLRQMKLMFGKLVVGSTNTARHRALRFC